MRRLANPAVDIWRVRPAGGPHERVAQGGSFGLESADGRSVLYQPGQDESALFAVPLGGGPAREIVKCVFAGGFFSAPQGIYYVACGPKTDAAVHLQHPDTGHDELVGKLENAATSSAYYGLAVSPDGTKVLYSKVVSQGSDVMMIENFR